MKILIKQLFIICISIAAVSSHAQEVRNKSKELGLFVETAMNNFSFSTTALGLQFRKETKINRALRLQVLFQQRNFRNETYDYAMVNDTLKEIQLFQKGKNVFVGFGMEQQRQFYRKVHLYASIDARIGYGYSTYYKTISSTVIDTSNSFYYQNPARTLSTPEKISSIKSNRIALDILPFIGSKLIFQHLVLGFETGLNISNAYLSERGIGVKQYSIYDLEVNFFQYRAYLNYRF